MRIQQDLWLREVMGSNKPDICAFAGLLLLSTRLSFQIRETTEPVHYCKMIDKAKKVNERSLIFPDNDFTIEAIYWYSQRHVHEVFIFITILRKEATLIIIIARSPGKQVFTSTQIPHGNDCSTPKGEGRTPIT